jgi:hypothetical protein
MADMVVEGSQGILGHNFVPRICLLAEARADGSAEVGIAILFLLLCKLFLGVVPFRSPPFLLRIPSP